MKEYQNISHGFGPVYNRESRILILGSFPSVKSREQAFFYGHPRNRFWKVLAAVLKEDEPETVEEKKEMLLRRGVAVYDVIEQCSAIFQRIALCACTALVLTFQLRPLNADLRIVPSHAAFIIRMPEVIDLIAELSLVT